MQPHIVRAVEGVVLLVADIARRFGLIGELARRAGLGRRKDR